MGPKSILKIGLMKFHSGFIQEIAAEDVMRSVHQVSAYKAGKEFAFSLDEGGFYITCILRADSLLIPIQT